MKRIEFRAQGDPEETVYEGYEYVIGYATGAQLDEEYNHAQGCAFNAVVELHELAEDGYYHGDSVQAGTAREAIEVLKSSRFNQN